MNSWVLGIVGSIATAVVISLLSFVAVTVNENKLDIAKYQSKFEEIAEVNAELLQQVESYETLTYQNWVAINLLYQHLGLTRNNAPASPFRQQIGGGDNLGLRNGLADRSGRKPRPLPEVDTSIQTLGARKWGGSVFGTFTL